MFDEVTKREGGKRAARRGIWLAASTAVQVAIVVGIVLLSAAVAQHEVEAPLVDVKIVRAAPPPPPPPPPPPAAPRAPTPPQPKPKEPPRPRPPMVQPKEVPAELKPPDPTPPEPEDTGSDEGVEGGVIGGVVGGDTAGAVAPAPTPPPPPPPPPPPKPTGPVKFDQTMTAPQVVSAPPLEYTQQALEHEVEGTMVVECVIRASDGTVYGCRVVKGLPFMDAAVIANLEHRRYKPATQAGHALDVQYTFTIRLKLPE